MVHRPFAQVFLRQALAAALVAGLTLLAAAAGAQEGAPASEEPATPEYSEEKLQAFADAAAEVVILASTIRPRLMQAENEEEQQALMEEANQEIEARVEAAPGITPAEYRQIGEHAQQDPELKARLDQMVTDAFERKRSELEAQGGHGAQGAQEE